MRRNLKNLQNLQKTRLQILSLLHVVLYVYAVCILKYYKSSTESDLFILSEMVIFISTWAWIILYGLLGGVSLAMTHFFTQPQFLIFYYTRNPEKVNFWLNTDGLLRRADRGLYSLLVIFIFAIARDLVLGFVMVAGLFFEEMQDSSAFIGKEVRLIRDTNGFYFITGDKFKNIYVFRAYDGAMVMANKIFISEFGIEKPAFNQRVPFIELVEGGKSLKLNSEGIYGGDT